MTSTALARSQNIETEMRGAGSLVVQGPIGTDDWRTLAQIANVIGNTEFVPKGLRNNKPAIMACLLYGRDQGVPAMIALTEISVVDGRPTMSANLMAAKARANGHRISREEHRDANGELTAVTAKGVARDGTEDEITWTLDDAKRAGLLGKTNWQKYPRQMLWARAVSELCRTLFNDAFLGSVYTVDEVDDVLDQHSELDGEYAEVSGATVSANSAASEQLRAEPSTPDGSAPTSPQIPGAGNGGTADAAGEVDAPLSQTASPAATATTSADVVLDTGKHRGKTVAQVAAEDPGYLWAAQNFKTGALKDGIADYLAEHPDTPKETVAGEQTELDT